MNAPESEISGSSEYSLKMLLLVLLRKHPFSLILQAVKLQLFSAKYSFLKAKILMYKKMNPVTMQASLSNHSSLCFSEVCNYNR